MVDDSEEEEEKEKGKEEPDSTGDAFTLDGCLVTTKTVNTSKRSRTRIRYDCLLCRVEDHKKNMDAKKKEG